MFASAAFAILFALLGCAEAWGQAKAAAVNPDEDCLACHSQKDLKSEAGQSVYVDAAKHKAGAHAILNCSDCHTTIKGFPHPARVAKVECATCHAEEAADVPKSAHGLLGPEACNSCHGSAHEAVATAGRKMPGGAPALLVIPDDAFGCAAWFLA